MPIIFVFQKIYPGWVTDKCYDLLGKWKYRIITEILQGKLFKTGWTEQVKEKQGKLVDPQSKMKRY